MHNATWCALTDTQLNALEVGDFLTKWNHYGFKKFASRKNGAKMTATLSLSRSREENWIPRQIRMDTAQSISTKDVKKYSSRNEPWLAEEQKWKTILPQSSYPEGKRRQQTKSVMQTTKHQALLQRNEIKVKVLWFHYNCDKLLKASALDIVPRTVKRHALHEKEWEKVI